MLTRTKNEKRFSTKDTKYTKGTHEGATVLLVSSMLTFIYTVTLCVLCVTFVSFVFSTLFVLSKYRSSDFS